MGHNHMSQDALHNLPPLLSDNGNKLHDFHVPCTLIYDRSSLVPKWSISTLIKSRRYQKESPPHAILAQIIHLSFKLAYLGTIKRTLLHCSITLNYDVLIKL